MLPKIKTGKLKDSNCYEVLLPHCMNNLPCKSYASLLTDALKSYLDYFNRKSMDRNKK